MNKQDSNELQNRNTGEINFIKEKKYSFVKNIFRVITFVLLAIISGGVSGYYFSSKSNVDIAALLQKSTKSNDTNNTVKNVAEKVGQSIVGISNSNSNGGVTSIGSGVIFSSDGYIITSYHIIKGKSSHVVNFPSSKNNTPLAASVVGYDPLYDLAVLKVAAKSLPYAKLGDSSKLEVGDIAIAIGNPSGEQFSGVVTTGVISALNKQVERSENGDNVNYKVLQTDARIYTGNIGGALCDANGNVIGINSFSNSDGALGNAVPINDVNTIVNSIIKTGHVIRPDIGFTSRDYYDKSKKITGVIVKSVLAGSGASNAGIKIGDIVTQLDTIPIKSIDEIGDILEAHKVGDSVPCVIYRNGKYLNISIVLSGKADDN